MGRLGRKNSIGNRGPNLAVQVGDTGKVYGFDLGGYEDKK